MFSTLGINSSCTVHHCRGDIKWKYLRMKIRQCITNQVRLIAWKSNTKINVVNIRSPFFVDFFETFHLIKWTFLIFYNEFLIHNRLFIQSNKNSFDKSLKKVFQKRWPDIDHVNFNVRFLGYKTDELILQSRKLPQKLIYWDCFFTGETLKN